MSFQGFDPAVIDFMWGLRFNNSREWFEPRKAEYKEIFETPMKELCRELYAGYADKHSDLPLVSRVSRIYRDARRLFGRGPYKDHLWLTVAAPSERWSCQPVFWFELCPENYSMGLGYWMAQASTMAKLRARIDRDPKPVEKLARAVERRGEFVMDGQAYKRPKGDPGALLYSWYNSRQISFSRACNCEGVFFTSELANQVLEGWRSLVPQYKFLCALPGDPEPNVT